MGSLCQGSLPERSRDRPVKRPNVNIPEALHVRFKTVCSATNREMSSEIIELVERRVAELEEEAGLWGAEAEPGASRAEVLERALTCNFPTGDIDEILGRQLSAAVVSVDSNIHEPHSPTCFLLARCVLVACNEAVV